MPAKKQAKRKSSGKPATAQAPGIARQIHDELVNIDNAWGRIAVIATDEQRRGRGE